MKINEQHHKAILIVITAGLIFCFGRLSVQYQIHQGLLPVQKIPEINSKIPMVEITGIQDGKIFGNVNKAEIRLKSGDSVAVPDEQKNFVLNIQHLGFLGVRVPVMEHKIPEEAQFVASKNGKYYYELDEASAKNLSVENRMYFATEEEAVKAGFQKRTR